VREMLESGCVAEDGPMPLLPAEPCLYPADLFAGPDPPDGGVWWVLHTRPRAEKAVARSLFSGGVAFFLPVYEFTRRTGGRRQTSQLPLFPGYVFLRAEDEGRTRALETNQVATCIPVPDQGQLRQELESVHRVMTSGVPIGPEAQLVPGAAVTIARGPLAGLRGKVLRRGNRLTLVVEVNLLRQGVSVEIESWMVEAVSGGERPGA
jgi:transcription antitermination factor NusG